MRVSRNGRLAVGNTPVRERWAGRLVLLAWRCFPRRIRGRHGEELAEMLALLPAGDEAPRNVLAEPGSPQGDPAAQTSRLAFSESALVIDALSTLVRAWLGEIDRRFGRPTAWAGPQPPTRSAGHPGPSGPGGRRPHFGGIVQDVRNAARLLRRAPGFTLVAVLTLGLGIGATTTFFSLVDGILLDPLPYEEPDRLVKLKVSSLDDGAPPPGTWANGESYPDALDLRRDQVFQSLAVFTRQFDAILLGGDEPVRVDAGFAEAELFALLGMPAAYGRTLAPGDRQTIVLADGVWRRYFGADPDVIGETVLLDAQPHVVVGVMPPGFLAGGIVPRDDLPDVWVPLEETRISLDSRVTHLFQTFARLADGVTLEQARAAMRVASARIHGDSADPSVREANYGIWLTPLHDEVVGDAGSTLWLLLGAVGLLLLITCANAANLQLTRVAARRREAAVRIALGAGPLRIVRQLLAETLMIGLLGGTVGLLLTVAGLRAFAAFNPGDIPRLEGVDIDGSVLAFTLAASIATGLLFGIVPAVRGSSCRMPEALQEGGRGTSHGRASRHLRDGLLVGEVALALVLVAAAGLVVASFLHLDTYDLGLEASDVLTFQLELGSLFTGADGERRDMQASLAAVDDFHKRLFEQLEAMPQVAAIAGADRLPVQGGGAASVEGRPGRPAPIGSILISGDYFEVLRIPLLAGRPIDGAHWRGSGERPTEVVLNAAAIEELWPGSSPSASIGRQITIEAGVERGSSVEVVGVVGNVRHGGLDPQPRPELFLQQGRFLVGRYQFLVRTYANPLAIAPEVREAVWALAPQVPVEDMRTLEQAIASTMARPRFYAFLFSIFGVLALALTAPGLAGVVAYAVAQRSHEIGIRRALGASRARVVRSVMGHGLALVFAGITIGLMATWWLGRLLEGFLHGVTPTDPATLAAVSVLLGLVALAGLAIPARRAAAVDPVRVLRDG